MAEEVGTAPNTLKGAQSLANSLGPQPIHLPLEEKGVIETHSRLKERLVFETSSGTLPDSSSIKFSIWRKQMMSHHIPNIGYQLVSSECQSWIGSASIFWSRRLGIKPAHITVAA